MRSPSSSPRWSGPTSAERAAFVAAACAPDEALRRRVEALLKAHDAAGSFLGGPPCVLTCGPATLTDGGRRPARRHSNTLTILSLAPWRDAPCPASRPRWSARRRPFPGPPAGGEAKCQSPSAALSLLRRDRPGRHGSDPQGARHRAEPRPRLQGPPGPASRQRATSCAASSRRHRSAASSSTPASCRSTSWASCPIAGRSSP